jgi:hypothetical protein
LLSKVNARIPVVRRCCSPLIQATRGDEWFTGMSGVNYFSPNVVEAVHGLVEYLRAERKDSQ